MKLLKLPGLIDIHVHLRDPGQTYKEDFYTGSSTAIAGGFTTILDMPNNKEPIISLNRLKNKIKEAKQKAVCDVGFYSGSLGDNLEELMKMEPYVFGLKLYLNKTTGNFIINEKKLDEIFSAWKSDKPILVHAEEDILNLVLISVQKAGKKVHICHVSNKKQLQMIIRAKTNNLPVSCGVTPHHLFLTNRDLDKLGTLGLMRPRLGNSSDQDFLWKNFNYIDVIESDHAPHTQKEKKSADPPFGVPGLETTLPLLLTAVSKNRISIKHLIEMCYEKPKKIFNIKTENDTYIEIDPKEEYIISNKKLKTKCGWSPFDEFRVKGKVKRVFIRGNEVYNRDKFLVNRGFGKVIIPT